MTFYPHYFLDQHLYSKVMDKFTFMKKEDFDKLWEVTTESVN